MVLVKGAAEPDRCSKLEDFAVGPGQNDNKSSWSSPLEIKILGLGSKIYFFHGLKTS